MLLASGCAPPDRDAVFAGCPHVETSAGGPLCLRRPDRPLNLRVRLAGARSVDTVQLDGRAVSVDAAAVADGMQFDLAVPVGVSRLTVDVEPPGRWTLILLDDAPEPAIATARAAAPAEPAARGRALRAASVGLEPRPAADVLLEAGHFLHVGGDFEAAAAALQQAADVAERAGAHSRAAAALSVHAYHATERAHRFVDARQALDRMSGLRLGPRRQAELAYMRALLAYNVGDLRSARTHAITSATRATAWADPRAPAYREFEAEVWMALGQRARARAILADLRGGVDALGRPLERAQRLNNHAWVDLLGPIDRPPARDPRPDLLTALELYAGVEQVDPCAIWTTRLNLALAHLKLGESAQARAVLDSRPRPRCGPVDAAWFDLIDARLLLEADPAAAHARYAALGRRAEASGMAEVRWRALVGRGEALEASGRLDDAATAYADAEALLDSRLSVLALIGGGERFLADRGRSARLLVDLLVRRGRPAEALCAARRARRRQLAGLARVGRLGRGAPTDTRWAEALGRYRRARAALEAEAADDWSRSVAELRAVETQRATRLAELDGLLESALATLDGPPTEMGCPPLPSGRELLLAWFPGRGDWLAFAAHTHGVVAGRLDGDPTSTPARLFAPLAHAMRDHLPTAQRVVILATGAVNPVPIHAVPFDGAPLIDAAPVVYGLDLPPSADTRHAEVGGRALVIGDPRSDLRGARREAAAVARTLAAGGWQIERLGGVDARADAVRAALPRVAALHYAGHGEVDPLDQWAGRLPLAGGSWLGIGDVLAAPAVPRRVVLSGCRTGLPVAEALSGGMSFAHAFLLAGAEAVIGTTRDVDDAVAARFSALLYRGSSARPDADVGQAFRAAARALRAEQADRWSDFRLWVP